MLLGSYYLSIEPSYCINICININFVNYKKYPSVRWHQYRNTNKEKASDNTELYTERQTVLDTDKTPAEQNIYTKYYQNNHFVFFHQRAMKAWMCAGIGGLLQQLIVGKSEGFLQQDGQHHTKDEETFLLRGTLLVTDLNWDEPDERGQQQGHQPEKRSEGRLKT